MSYQLYRVVMGFDNLKKSNFWLKIPIRQHRGWDQAHALYLFPRLPLFFILQTMVKGNAVVNSSQGAIVIHGTHKSTGIFGDNYDCQPYQWLILESDHI